MAVSTGACTVPAHRRGRSRVVVRLATAAVLLLLGLAVPQPGGAATGDQPRTWNFEQAAVPGAQQPGRHGEGVTVAVVDTWIDTEHPDLRGRVAGQARCVGEGGRCREAEQRRDRCTHGTHVAGTIASRGYGVAPQSELLAIQALSHDRHAGCAGDARDVAAGIRHATRHGADVINLSVANLVPGVFDSPAISDAVRHAARAGVVVVFAAGNTGLPAAPDYADVAIVVAATGPDGELAPYSARGSTVDLAAPGGYSGAGGAATCREASCVLSTVPGQEYELRQGTSMAAPHVAGTAALLAARVPDAGRTSILRSMRESGRTLSGTRHGRLDATAATRHAEALVRQWRQHDTGGATGETGSGREEPADTGTPERAPETRGDMPATGTTAPEEGITDDQEASPPPEPEAGQRPGPHDREYPLGSPYAVPALVALGSGLALMVLLGALRSIPRR
ncbi:S8 family serine peptidase [Haloechinothrix sp. LS1_15]|uniref:S8 family peptidase n=1 Tax=Haloechinothrix sp. LS1_15 TaxID=2652248 RepID=UPI00294AE0E8|nr:S8 family serine peptidase [Haloechinothrix sp. LS1_15]